jgi:hypothetical protein
MAGKRKITDKQIKIVIEQVAKGVKIYKTAPLAGICVESCYSVYRRFTLDENGNVVKKEINSDY